jgi:hypothetical protein
MYAPIGTASLAHILRFVFYYIHHLPFAIAIAANGIPPTPHLLSETQLPGVLAIIFPLIIHDTTPQNPFANNFNWLWIGLIIAGFIKYLRDLAKGHDV